MKLDLETVLTGRSGMTLDTASPLQRSICRCLDGKPQGELASLPEVWEAYGGEDAVKALPASPPAMVAIVSSVRSAKTMIAAADAICATQRVDVAGLKAGEVPRVSVVSLSKDLAKVAHRLIAGTLQASPALRHLLVDEPTEDTIVIRHPSGRPIEICTVAGSRAGGSLVARWSAGIIFDEAPRMVGSDDGAVVNLDDMLAAVRARILPGGRILAIGSPWEPFGPIFELVTEHLGKPSSDLVIIRGRGPAMNPQWFTAERCERLRVNDPAAYQTDVLGEFGSGESSPFNAQAVRESVGREAKWFNHNGVGFFLDAASGGRDSFAGMIGGWAEQEFADPWLHGRTDDGAEYIVQDPETGAYVRDPNKVKRGPMFIVEALIEERGGFWGQTTLDQIVRRFARVARTYGLKKAFGDNRERMGVEAELQRCGMSFQEMLWTNDTKADAVAALARIINEGRLAIPDEPIGHRMRDQLIRYRRSYTKTGRPTFEGKSDDLVACLLTAMMASQEGYMRGSPLRSANRRIETGPGYFSEG